MKRLLLFTLALTLVVVSLSFASDNVAPAGNSAEAKASVPSVATNHDQFTVTYFHGNIRCATCRKLEAYSHEAVTSAFDSDLKDSTLDWRVVNFEEKGNEHFVKDYQLYSQALIVSRIRNGKEVGWRNLDKIWELVGTKEDFVKYVQAQVRDFVNETAQSAEDTLKASADE